MQAAGGGSIVNFSSISFMMADKGYAAYITANAGIVGMTRTLAREFGPDRIRVNAVAPGWVLTERQKELWVTPESLAAHLSRQCLPDPIQPEDVAGTVLFLASGASRMMTSQTLILDGGYISS
jgi:NAD(P)-dependent dehydrogenase (short-subunit alcohol dehydrogenase family)